VVEVLVARVHGHLVIVTLLVVLLLVVVHHLHVVVLPVVIHVLLIVHRSRSFSVVELLIVVKLPLVKVVVPLLLCVGFASVH